jgi:hypothetical protein
VSLKNNIMVLRGFFVFRGRARSVVFLDGFFVFRGRARVVASSITLPSLPPLFDGTSISASIDVYDLSALLVGVRSDSKRITLLGA